jgi:D-arabinose 1-dehydrogenase-like Zn-dependent alcohol dehydrogenase
VQAVVHTCHLANLPTQQFKPGDKVYALTGQHAFWSRYGTYAEFVSTHESTLQPIPSQLSFQEAAAVPLAAMTAWQAMEPSMPLRGKRVLVHAGAGGALLSLQCMTVALLLHAASAYLLLHSVSTCGGSLGGRLVAPGYIRLGWGAAVFVLPYSC